MQVSELNSFLRKLTDSEKTHKLNKSDDLSKRYDLIKTTIINNKKVYEFSFDSILSDDTISIIKESRFTHIPLHRHKVIEINYIYSGQCTQIINDKKIVLNTGDVCILDRNTLHEVLSLEENDIVITIDMRKSFFTNGFLHKISPRGIIAKFLTQALSENNGYKSYLLFRNENDSELRMFFERLLCQYFSNNKQKEVIDAWMTIILSRLIQYRDSKQYLESNNKDFSKMIQILQYLERNYKTVSLTQAAKQFGYNSNYFSNYLKEHTGHTFQDLIMIKKLSEFCFYLVNSEEPIYKLIMDQGYENQGYFYKKFYEAYNMTPYEYRKLYTQI